MPHAIWKGNISFGLVNIPVGLYSAENRGELKFHLLDKGDLSPVGYRKVNKFTGREVGATELIRGYEYEEGRYVVLTDEDLRRADPKATQTVEILDFVDASSIHPVYYDKPYYLAPVGKGQKSYALLREVLKRTKKAAVARVVIHSREYIAAVIPWGRILELDLLRFAYELRDPSELSVPEEDLEKLGVTEKELDMAGRLVEGMISEWSPRRYRDTYREDLLSYIKKKIETGETEKAPEAPLPEAPGAEVIDLMSLLKKSVQKAEEERAGVQRAAGK